MQLYAENILDHYRNPHHAGVLKKPTIRVVEHNPLCGDVIQLDLQLSSRGAITDIAFHGSGCAISQASMSLLADELAGSAMAGISRWTPQRIVAMLGIPISPARMKCALLSAGAATQALKKFQENFHASKKETGRASIIRKKNTPRTARKAH